MPSFPCIDKTILGCGTAAVQALNSNNLTQTYTSFTKSLKGIPHAHLAGWKQTPNFLKGHSFWK
jgi:hypothetical protein